MTRLYCAIFPYFLYTIYFIFSHDFYFVYFLFFLREELLQADANSIPEIIQRLGFRGEEDIDSVVSEAIAIYKITPRSLCR